MRDINTFLPFWEGFSVVTIKPDGDACRRRRQIEPSADARLTPPQIDTNVEQAMVFEESDWVRDISATRSIRRRRQQAT
ncbi:hypothetical protein EKA85_27505 [Pseudomonas veronii]|nr:hypothetical protein C1Y30_18700 [Pseudomonas sp. GW704-F3]PMU93266.1 hypothetical protein C1Y28_19680 [Pseudomonas sp. GW704-F5]PMV03355.1 hypothetical protein C1Y29_14980 [Pseudomonas sp. MPBD4-3]PMV27635.1 hypothetical protein C1Y27_22100 [Pseudomonas sp. GW704-F2]RTY61742.1 hypothetical protein EKA85_27505 [Pseudomonas veronii]